MKPITKEDCELMWVWDVDSENPKTTRARVVSVSPDGRCIALSSDGDWFVSWQHCAPVEKEKAKKLVPCECREDLPNGWPNGWLKEKDDGRRTLVGTYLIEADGRIINNSWRDMFTWYEWSPTFDGPWQPIGKMVEVNPE